LSTARRKSRAIIQDLAQIALGILLKLEALACVWFQRFKHTDVDHMLERALLA
jgi:hypothetical protein